MMNEEIEKILFERVHIRHIDVCKRLNKRLTAQEILDGC